MYDLSGMPEIGVDYRIPFPNPSRANREGILALGGNLSPGVLLSAYQQGIFPWYGPGEPIIWWSPNPRFIVPVSNMHISSRTLRTIGKSGWRMTIGRDFPAVIEACSTIRRSDGGTWITPEMLQAYVELNRLGYAISVEVWDEAENLIGGLYGVGFGKVFCGESMFSRVSQASKFAFLGLGLYLESVGIDLIDSQVANPHMESLGGIEIVRSDYLRQLDARLGDEALAGWSHFEMEASEAVAAHKNRISRR